MAGFIVKWAVNTVALFIVIKTVGGVGAEDWQTIITAAFVLGLFNAFLKPIVILLTLPINILSFGLFTLIINGFFFYLASKFVKGFTVMDFWSAFWAAIVFSVISLILNTLVNPSARFTFRTFRGEDSGRTAGHDDAIDVEGKVVDKNEDKERLE